MREGLIKSENFKSGSYFETALKLYRFDRQLRILLFNQIEKIEISIRSTLSNLICDLLQDDHWPLKGESYVNPKYVNSLRPKMVEAYANSKEEFIKYDFENGGIKDSERNKKIRGGYVNEKFIIEKLEKLPAWMVFEIMPFGALYHLYDNLVTRISTTKGQEKNPRKVISNYYGLHEKVFRSWIQEISVLRNMCCHHARVWNKIFSTPPTNCTSSKYPHVDFEPFLQGEPGSAGVTYNNNRVYLRICIIRYFLFTLVPSSDFKKKLERLLYSDDYKNTVDIKSLGFPDNWEEEPFWKYDPLIEPKPNDEPSTWQYKNIRKRGKRFQQRI